MKIAKQKSMIIKTAISVWHSAQRGKTETLREFANLLLLTYPSYIPIYPTPINIPPIGDFRLIVEINGKIIGIETQGDPNTNLRTRLSQLVHSYKCDIILCTSRTRGRTVAAVQYLENVEGYELIWTSTYQIADIVKHNIVNQLKAKHILDLLRNLSRI